MRKFLFCIAILGSLTATAQNVGVGNSAPASKLDVSGDISLREGTALTVATGVNSLTLPSSKNSVYRLTGAAGAFSISSISGSNDGMLLTLINATGQVMTITNGSIQTNTGANLVASGSTSSVILIYNSTLAKWLVISGEGFISTAANNIYTIDGTLSGSRTVTQAASDLTFSSTTGNHKFTTTGTGSVAMGNTVSATGANSFATGNNNTASGNYSAVTGQGNSATSTYSLVSGVGNVDNGSDDLVGGSINLVQASYAHSIAVGINDTVAASAGAVFGYKNRIAAFEAFAQGDRNTASGQSSAVFGASNYATGGNAFVTGYTNVGSGTATMVSGTGNTASGTNSFATGNNNTASGNYSAVTGQGNTATSTYSLVSGVGNVDNGSDDLIGGSINLVLASYAHSIAAGINDTVAASAGAVFGFKNRIAAFEAFAQGDRNTASGQSSAVFGASNYATGGNAFVTGYTNVGSGSATMVSGTGNKASGNNSSVSGQSNTVPATASLVSGSSNTDNGISNVVGGTANTIATGYGYSAVIGNGNTVSGSAGAVFGYLNTISAFEAFAQGDRNTASGQAASVFGANNVASGNNTVVYGLNNTAPSYAELEGGTYATTYTASSATSISATDRLFNIGNGTGVGARSDAFTILKNGNVGIGNNSPTSKLQVNGTTTTTNLQMTNGAAANSVLTGDATGNGTWSTGTGLFIQNQTTADQVAGFRINGNGIFNGGGVSIGNTAPGTNLLNVSNASASGAGITGYGINLSAQAGGSNAQGGAVNINAGQGGNPAGGFPAGGSVSIVAGAGGAGGTSGTTGGNVTIAANGSSYCGGCGLSGGSVNIYSGGPISGSTLTPGDITFNTGFASPTQAMIVKGSNTFVGIGQSSPNSKLDVNGNIQISNATIPMGLQTEVGGTTPLLNFDVNFRETNKNTTYRGAALRIDTRTGSPLFQWITRAAGTATENIPMVLLESGNLGIGTTIPSNMLTVAASAGNSGVTLSGLTSSFAATTLPMGLNSSGTVVDGSRHYYTTGSVTGGWNGNTGKQVGSFTATGRPYLVIVNASQWGNSGAIHFPSLSIGSGSGGTQVCAINPFYYNESGSHKLHSTSTVYTFPAGTVNLYIWTGDSSDTGDSATVTVIEL